MGDAKQAARVICAREHPGQNATMWSKGKPNAYFELDLKTVTLLPTYFAYRNDYGGGGNHPRSFELQGSHDGKAWTTLSTHASAASSSAHRVRGRPPPASPHVTCRCDRAAPLLPPPGHRPTRAASARGAPVPPG